MGLLAKTDAQVLLDRLTQRLIASLDFDSMASGNANEGLARYLDGVTSDPDLQAALLPTCAGVDRQSLTANKVSWLDSVLANPSATALIRALSTYVTSAAGGGHTNIGAYIASTGATIHPLTAELIRKVLGESALTVNGSVVGAMAPLMQAVPFYHVYAGTLGSLADETTDASSATEADVDLFTSNGDVLVLQSRSRFGRVLIGCSTLASSNVGLSARYWNGSAWATMTLTDNTTGLSANGGMISWTIPTDWVPSNEDSQESPARLNGDAEEELYSVIITRTQATVATPPVAAWILTVPEAVSNSIGLYGVDQPPLAIVRITAANTATVTSIQDPSTRFVLPSGANNSLRLRAITPIAQAITFTLGYRNQGNEAATKAQSAWADGKVPGDTQSIIIDAADTGLLSITPATCAISTTATSGLFIVERCGYERAIGGK